MKRVFNTPAGAVAGRVRHGKGIVDKGAYELDTRHRAQAAYPRIKVLVIHYTADDFDSSLATLTDKNVSSHYLIGGRPHRTVNRASGSWFPRNELARHAGISFLARHQPY